MDGALLKRSGCYFGGGTQVALAFGEFRESRDIDFLCSSRAGFRLLRETVTETSLGALLDKPLPLAREVRTDRDGIRTFIVADEQKIKFEIVLEARIELSGALDRKLGVPALDIDCMVAEKLLANSDRGLDASTNSRDLIDLAFIVAARGAAVLAPGMHMAESAYGTAVRRQLGLVLAKFASEQQYAAQCARSLGIEDTATLKKGLALLKRLVARPTTPGP